MRFRSLRARLIATTGALIVSVTLATLAYVSLLANRTVDGRLAEDLERSRRAVAAAEAQQFSRLQLMAQMVASFPELRALLATDTATVRDFLSDYRERNGHDGVLIALDGRGQVVARSDTFAPLTLPDVEQTWLAPLGRGPARARLRHHRRAPSSRGGVRRRIRRHRVRRRPRNLAD